MFGFFNQNILAIIFPVCHQKNFRPSSSREWNFLIDNLMARGRDAEMRFRLLTLIMPLNTLFITILNVSQTNMLVNSGNS